MDSQNKHCFMREKLQKKFWSYSLSVDIGFYDSWEKIEVALTTEQPTLASWQINKIYPIDS